MGRGIFMKTKIYQLGILSLSFVLLVSGQHILDGKYASFVELQACDTVAACDAENASLAEEKSKLQKRLQETKAEQNNLTEEMALMVDQLNLIDTELTSLKNAISELLKEIEILEQSIKKKEIEVRKLLQQQQKEANNNVYLSLLLSSKSISDFTIKMNAVETMNGAKQQHITELQATKETHEAAKIKLDAKKQEQEQSKAEQEKLIAESEETLKKLNALAEQMDDKIGDIEMNQDEINRQRAIVGAAANSDNGDSTGAGGLVPPSNGWHLPAATGWLTCPIGCYSDHIGTDFGMRVGTDVYAIADGTVIYTQWSTASTGYGTMVTIAHNINGVPHISIYGHLSSIGVRVGDVVRGGQYIAASGNTGASTGPHLHVEIVHSTNVFVDKSFRRSHLVDARDVLPRPSGGWRW